MYGYELVQAIRTKTNQAISLGEGVVYPALHALERESMLKSRRKLVNGRTRVYYSVTRNGEKHLAGLVRHWQHITGAIGLAIGGTAHAATAL
jgi:PadR family transcriptional regulator PadR